MENFGGLIVLIVAYAYFAFCTLTIANKTGTENSWFAWIPVLNIYLLVKVAQKPGWWLILFLIPIVNIVIGIIVWMKISELLRKPSWLGILFIIPFLNFILIGYLAFSE